MSQTLDLPSLAPPGAGLPTVELSIARMLFRLRLLTGSRRSYERDFANERARVAKLYRDRDPANFGKRVLINRLAGMEDSSRFWSVWMTLDHLRIVNHGIATTMRALLAEQTPARAASTAAVKPSESAGPDVVEPYEASCDAVLTTAKSATDLRTAKRHAHPWFGPLDALQWFSMAGMHMAIHRKQIEKVLDGASKAK